MKTKKKLLLTSLSVMLVGSLTTGLTIMAFADSATQDHEFDAKTDVVWENFDRVDITDTVTVSDTNVVDTGEKSYLHVEYSTPTDFDNPIFKQGLNAAELGTKALVIEMRAPEGDVHLSDLLLALRHSDDYIYRDIPFTELGLDEIDTEWQTYVIGFENMEYWDGEYFADGSEGDALVSTGELLGLHIYNDSEAGGGTLDIRQIYYNMSDEDDVTVAGREMINDFMGGDTLLDTAATGTWWSESVGGIVKRAVTLEGGNFTVIKTEEVGDFSYAVIEAQGDTENLKVATTTDGTTFGSEVAYDGSVALTGSEKGFKFIYDGEESVTVKRIYLTNLSVKTPATAVPVIDAETVKVVEDFSVAQSSITGDYDSTIALPEMNLAGMWYRLSYSHADWVKVENGSLVFDATDLDTSNGDDWINFKFQSKTALSGKYLVFKVKGEEGANVGKLTVNLGFDGALTNAVGAAEWKAGYAYPANIALDESNPYAAGDGWFYIVVDVEETWSKVDLEAGVDTFDMYYRGDGSKLYIDSIFFADKLANVEKQYTADGVTYVGTEEGYDYAGGFALNNKYGTATTLSFDITPDGDDFDPSNLRIELGSGVYWACNNPQGQLITTDGKYLDELTYTKDVATHVEIDVAASGIGAFTYAHVHVGAIGGFTLDNVVLNTSTAKEDFAELSKTVVELETVIDFDGTGDGYNYAGGIDVAYNHYGILKFDITPSEDFVPDGIRFEFAGVGMRWFSENDAGVLLTTEGKKLSELEFTADQTITVEIDLLASAINSGFSVIHIHTNGSDTGAFKLENIKFTELENNYAEQVAALAGSIVDSIAPIITITNNGVAETGDEITIAYTVADNNSASDDITVTVTVTRNGESVTVSGGKFTASVAGTYVIKVVAVDEAGNESVEELNVIVTDPDVTPDEPTTDPETPDEPSTDPDTKPEEEKKSGCGSMVTGGIGGLIALGAVACIVAVTVVVRKRKSN